MFIFLSSTLRRRAKRRRNDERLFLSRFVFLRNRTELSSSSFQSDQDEQQQRPTTRSRSISERGGGTTTTSNKESSAIVTRKRKASIVLEQSNNEKKRASGNYVQQLEGQENLLSLRSSVSLSLLFRIEMKDQFMKINSTRQLNCSSQSSNQMINKLQLKSRLKVIDFLKDQLYPTGKIFLRSRTDLHCDLVDAAISAFQLVNQELFPKKRLLNQRIREIRQKLMNQYQQQQQQSPESTALMPRDIEFSSS